MTFVSFFFSVVNRHLMNEDEPELTCTETPTVGCNPSSKKGKAQKLTTVERLKMKMGEA